MRIRLRDGFNQRDVNEILDIDKDATGYRLFTKGGRAVSPRLSCKEMKLFLSGMLAGLNETGS